MNEDFIAIRKIVQGNVREQVLAGIVIIAFALGMLFFLTEGLPKETTILFQIFGGLFACFGLYVFLSGIRNFNSSKHRVIHCLEKDPRKIVWFYSYVVINMPYGVRLFRMASIFIFFVNGDQTLLRVKEKDLDRSMQILRKLLPHATVGHNIEREQLFKANPALLYQD